MSFTKLTYHVVFSPRNRAQIIRQDIERDFYLMLYRILKQYHARVYRIGGMPDHIHILFELPATVSLCKFIQSVKRESSAQASTLIQSWPGWQEGYGGFTCGFAEIERIKTYIANQKEHHRVRTFRDEYRDWLIENGVAPDEPYFPK